MRRPEPRRGASSRPGGIANIADQHGLEQRHLAALLTVALYEPMTVTQLSERQRIALNTASLIAVELERAGLLERREDPDDRRRTILTIAPGKRKLVQEGLSKRAEGLRRALERLTPAQRDGLIRGLEVLVEETSG
jgi:DNA-binding MarR family transcriptional regulator